MVNSTPRPSADDLDPIFDDALNTDIFFDGMSNNDDLTAFTPPMNLFNSDLTTDPNLIGAQDNLLAFDTNTDNSCSAEESQPFSAIGKLRRREDGKSCTSPTKESSEQTVDPFLLQLPIVDEVAAPEIKSRKDICPVYLFDFRDIALCSAAVPQTMLTLGGNTITTISDAMFYNDFYGCFPLQLLYCCSSVAIVRPSSLHAEKPWQMTGYNCMLNTKTVFPVPKS